MPLASSLEKTVMSDFLSRVMPPLVPVHFIFDWPDEGCMHAVYIDAISAFKGEAEMLLAAFSVVELVSITECAEPIEIRLKVIRDNKQEPEYLPVTDWH